MVEREATVTGGANLVCFVQLKSGLIARFREARLLRLTDGVLAELGDGETKKPLHRNMLRVCYGPVECRPLPTFDLLLSSRRDYCQLVRDVTAAVHVVESSSQEELVRCLLQWSSDSPVSYQK